MLAKYARQIDPEALLALGKIPAVGKDERFPNGFTIAAENAQSPRRGRDGGPPHGPVLASRPVDELVPAVCGHLDLRRIQEGLDRRADRNAACGPGTGDRPGPLPSPLSDRGHVRAPRGGLPERDGSYVNRHDHLQSVRWASPPAGGPRGVFCGDPRRSGLYDARTVLPNCRRDRYSTCRRTDPTWRDLKVNLLAEARHWKRWIA